MNLLKAFSRSTDLTVRAEPLRQTEVEPPIDERSISAKFRDGLSRNIEGAEQVLAVLQEDRTVLVETLDRVDRNIAETKKSIECMRPALVGLNKVAIQSAPTKAAPPKTLKEKDKTENKPDTPAPHEKLEGATFEQISKDIKGMTGTLRAAGDKLDAALPADKQLKGKLGSVEQQEAAV